MQPSEPTSSVRTALISIWDHAAEESGIRCGHCLGKGEVTICDMAFECTACGGEGSRIRETS